MEAAAGGDVGGIGGFAGEDDALGGIGEDGEEGLGVGVLGVGEDRFGGAGFDDAAEVHDGYSVGDVPGEAQVVGDDQGGQAEVVAKAEDQGEDLAADRGVQGGDGFVGDQDLGVEGERTGDDDALALTAGEFVGIAMEEALRRA